MLSLAKLAGTDQRYYLDQAKRRVDHTESVASGAEDYYLSGPEAAGEWVGGAATDLALEGDVGEVELRQVLARRDPRSGEVLPGSVSRARVPGFDLMFSVPKTASVIFGIGDGQTQRAVLAAQHVAVRAAVDYLESRACRTRRGPGGCEIVEGRGFVGAAFRHRTSRAGDPQVHTHVLVANATRTDRGDWGSLDGRALYAEARTAGFVHEAVFRRELTRRLGVRWSPARNGIAEIEGVPRVVVEAFSRRKAEIDTQVAEWGTNSAAARQKAAVKTRARKDYEVTPDRLAPEWRERALDLGLDHRRLRELCGRTRAIESSTEEQSRLTDRLLSPEGLTERKATFDRRDVVRAVATAAVQGITLSEIDAFVSQFVHNREVITLADAGGAAGPQDVIRRRDGRIVSALVDSPVYSTAELLAVEQRAVEAARAQRGVGVGIADGSAVEAALDARPSVGADQAEMVRRICREGDGVHVVVGPPGTGKTFALDAAREAWQRSGFTVYGAAVARRAAMELADAAGIESTSVAALLADLRHGTSDLLSPSTVLVVDEAGMLGTRHVAELIERLSTAGAKLVLVGDQAQLPEIDAGGAFRALVSRLDPIVLDTNRRQVREEDRRLLGLWRDGRLREAMTLASEQGDLVLGLSADEVERRLVLDFCEAIGRGEDAVMLAHRRSDVRRLNALARFILHEDGRIGPDVITLPAGSFAPGDHVVLRLNAPRLRVENGTRAEVVGFDRADGLRLATADGRELTLPRWYLEAAASRERFSIEHGYALTAHLAQGMTTDRTFVLGSETVYGEWGYVAWSRARLGTRFYAVECELDEEHHSAAEAEREPFDEVVRRLERSEAQRLALETGIAAMDPLKSAAMRTGGDAQREGALLQRRIDEAKRVAEAATRERERLNGMRRRLGRAGRVRRTQIEAARQAEAEALWRVGHLTEALHEQRVDVMRAPDAVELTEIVDAPLERDVARDQQTLRGVRRAQRARVAYIESALGQRPDSLRARRRWDRAVRRIERFRVEHGITDRDDAFGVPPVSLAERRAWARARRDLSRTQLQLGLAVDRSERADRLRGL